MPNTMAMKPREIEGAWVQCARPVEPYFGPMRLLDGQREGQEQQRAQSVGVTARGQNDCGHLACR